MDNVNGGVEPKNDNEIEPLALLQVELVVDTDTTENEFGVNKDVA